MKTIILGISGRKQAGKTETFKFIERENAWNHRIAVVDFSFANALKTLCVEYLGLTFEQVYGTDAQKNSLVEHLLWENFPVSECSQGKSGPMTAREVMQFSGTEIFRRFYPGIWAAKALASIDNWVETEENFERSNVHTLVAVLPDMRFPNEADAVLAKGGRVLRLTRTPFPEDTHESETSLDRDSYDWDKFEVFDNSQLGVDAQMAGLSPWLTEIGAIR